MTNCRNAISQTNDARPFTNQNLSMLNSPIIFWFSHTLFLRHDIVWFGEEIHNHELSIGHVRGAGKVLVVGTSMVSVVS
jgi:NAD-dependent SIR2 family protein deacetylase